MSDHMVSVVRLDADEAEVLSLADEVKEWLLSQGIIEPNARRDSEFRPSEWMPGGRWRRIVEDHPSNDHFEELANNGVDLIIAREIHDSGENFHSPGCGHCGRELADDSYVETVELWLDIVEPTVECPACGWAAPLGDWPGQWAFAVGAPAVVFNNWPQLADEFLGDLRARLGGRTLVVRTHL